MDDKEKRFVHDLLEASLRRYASAEPRLGLEGRVLAGVRVRQEAARRRTMWAWGRGDGRRGRDDNAARDCTAMPSTHAIAGDREIDIASFCAALADIPPPAQPPLSPRPRRPKLVSRIDTRPQQFPTPRPLSEQEKLLLMYVKSLEASSEISVPATDQRADHDLEIAPISIAAIKIEPLASPESGDEK